MKKNEINNIAERIREDIYKRVKADFIKYTKFDFSSDYTSKTLACADTKYNTITFYLLQIHDLTESQIEHIVVHEFFHIIANRYYKKNVHHSKEYKDMLSKYGYDREIGRATMRSNRPKEQLEKKYKYKVVCRHCGKVVGYRQRKNNNIFFYRSTCCDSLLEFIEN